ncbi:fatty acid--CoA ligase family protein [Pseudomonas sp. LD120]|uniref:ANL family adenylate-forming protein n=1 Tax=Pseudomonas sp. LD120 TaxID=485751 RepID=UPI00135BE291|nr:fatty acid--CoA ligase family protein [Pseudomonas sp. LD120]KAF0864511.1 AMP-binding protein [Pseudomonas sp. LD120]
MAPESRIDDRWLAQLSAGPVLASLPAIRRSEWTRQLGELASSGQRRLLLVFDSTLEHAALLLVLLEQGLSPLLVASDAKPQELQRYAAQGAISHSVQLEQGELRVTALEPGAALPGASAVQPHRRGIYLLTSGTTGEPSLVFRDLNSWRDEGLRYCRLLQLSREDRVLFIAPVYHAYALGWLWGALLAGSQVEICKPTELGAALQALRLRASHCVVTPMLAALMAQRVGQGERPPQLKGVMSGAGPVDGQLDQQFQQAFGIGLSRNYGSTESGAVFAGVAPLPPLSIGFPMPGIEVVEPAAGQPFALKVRLEDGRLYDTGDIAEQSAAGYSIVGRESSAIRRGERWISPFEIESVLGSHPDVQDCAVRAVKSARSGNDHIFAFVVWNPQRPWDPRLLREHCQANLAPAKVPDRFERTPLIARRGNGKPLLSRRYRPAANQVLLEAAQAYKRSQLLLALWECGALQLSAQGLSVDQIAQRTGLHAHTLAVAFDTAQANGLLHEALEAETPPRDLEDLARVLDLESFNNRHWNRLDELLAVLHDGLDRRAFEQTPKHPQLQRRYQRAVAGADKQLAAQLTWRKALHNAPRAIALLDICATGAVYTQALLGRRRLDCRASRIVQLGGLNPPAADIPVHSHEELAQLDARGFDVIVLDNTLHQPSVVQALPALLERLGPDGRLIIDEIFFCDTASAAVGVDWLTHGGCQYPRQDEVVAALARLGFVGEQIWRRESMIYQCTMLFSRS